MGDGMGYTVLVALAGMAIVFCFLLLLSLLMVVTKRALGDREQEGATASDVSALRTKAGGGAAVVSDGEKATAPPPWLWAAVAAFVLAEHEARSAEPWIRGRKQ